MTPLVDIHARLVRPAIPWPLAILPAYFPLNPRIREIA